MKKILIIDHNQRHRFLLSDIFEDEGYEVDIAGNGKEVASKLIEEFDLILMDVYVPDFKAIDFLKINKDKCFILSVWADEAISLKLLDSKWIMGKPFDCNVLIERVQEKLKSMEE